LGFVFFVGFVLSKPLTIILHDEWQVKLQKNPKASKGQFPSFNATAHLPTFKLSTLPFNSIEGFLN
jgi:hypothetical protein